MCAMLIISTSLRVDPGPALIFAKFRSLFHAPEGSLRLVLQSGRTCMCMMHDLSVFKAQIHLLADPSDAECSCDEIQLLVIRSLVVRQPDRKLISELPGCLASCFHLSV